MRTKPRLTRPATQRCSVVRQCDKFRAVLFLLIFLLPVSGVVHASNHYTDRQMEALAERVGQVFWFNPAQQNTPLFSTTPTKNAATFRPPVSDSFEITELAGRAVKDPYYKVKFESGKIGYIRPEMFHEELNATIVSIDPLADEKKKAEAGAEEEKKRAAWIKSQPWAPAVKEAALRKQPALGLTSAEVKHVMGPPMRVTKVRASSKVHEEHWFYKDGSVLTFQNGLLSRTEKREK